MSFKKVVSGLFVLLLIGELLVRFDQKEFPFNSKKEKIAPVKITESREMSLFNADSVPLDDSIFRVLILGDSYTLGAGLNEPERFPNMLRQRLQSPASKYKNYLVLDATHTGNNTLDNYRDYLYYEAKFKPQAVILGYNLNDINDNLDENRHKSALKKRNHITELTPTQKFYNFIYHAHILKFLMHNLHNYLKTKGVVMPNTMFEKQQKAYTGNEQNWVKSKLILNKLIDSVSTHNRQLVVLLMPEYNMVNHTRLFTVTDTIIGEFFKGRKQVELIDTKKYYVNYADTILYISKYNGHPNATAHRILSDSVAVYLRRF